MIESTKPLAPTTHIDLRLGWIVLQHYVLTVEKLADVRFSGLHRMTRSLGVVTSIQVTELNKVKLGEEIVRVDTWIVGLIRNRSQSKDLSQVRQQFHEVISAALPEIVTCRGSGAVEGAWV